MDRPYVAGVRIEGYRCLKAVELALTPLHALIGPNDSGKSSILRAIRGGPVKELRFSTPLRSRFNRQLLRFDPDEMRAVVPLVTTSREEAWFENEKGRGLPGLYDLLLSTDRRSFAAVEDRFRALFPTVAALRLDNTRDGKVLGLTLVDGRVVKPEEMSEGMLYWLAFAIIEHVAPQTILLIEEPENGLHPARIREVMKVLREVSQRTQIILATHSPLVINELEPDEVTIVTRDPERGTICTPMTATKQFAARSKVYALGELWLAYADGDLERELVPEPTQDTAKAG